jgi:hypothetical protein
MLVAAVANPIVGRMGDLFGRRRTLLGALCILLLGAIVETFASTVEGLIAACAVQGVAGAVLPPSFGIVRDRLPSSRRPVVRWRGRASKGPPQACGEHGDSHRTENPPREPLLHPSPIAGIAALDMNM